MGFTGYSLARQVCRYIPKNNVYTVPHYSRFTLSPVFTLGKRWYSKSTTEKLKAADREKQVDLTLFPAENIRNFSIIAHIDHGKSTLADRLLELTNTISANGSNKQVLDKLKVERERGITVKAQTISMFYKYKGKDYLLNLIDTPGHVDFSYEVSRSLAACQGTLLLVDAAQGIQAQTVANFYLAYGEGLHIIPVLNKIDLPGAEPERVTQQIQSAFELDASDILQISAKSGINIDAVLPSVIEHIPCPDGSITKPFRALLFDSWYDKYVGVVCMLGVKDGVIRKGDKVISAYSDVKYEVTDVGIMHPEQMSTGYLHAGQVGYVVCGMKHASEAHIGDTFYHVNQKVEVLPGFQPAQSMVFAGIFPVDTNDFRKLDENIKKLTLNDASVSVHKETSNALGQGWRLGFLGTLHMDVFRQRLENEYEANIIVTQPTVPYRVVFKDGTTRIVRNPSDFPDSEERAFKVSRLEEPMVLATMIFPEEYMGKMIELCGSRRGEQQDYVFIDEKRVMMKYTLPLAEVVQDFYDELKSRSSGYATFDYEEAGYEESDLVKMTVLLNAKPVDALSVILHRSQVEQIGRDWVKRLKNVIQRQLFEVVIQTAIGTKIVARETISALRKNVTAKCYGGDVSRKMKLLQKQKEGKKRMKMIGNVELPQKAFYDFMDKKA
ncbi:P-loop containing nucleoside triphosphate hydrolase protein [Radiomyces spectabilis]|uniref:P-loop containing nucleoside triphosphate hydrolase protein n=1 Tax=Radiomyces spectabilis TaxID=64574 RepID=UPI002220CE94|nr:P-loop containing nucleoside triphosphate hydrolase protein [Radiomyces spectabilis]KAI8376501.1 P-loop containing nucleoside triphosphate hydrolase protein [Radiomyces spectabilis]